MSSQHRKNLLEIYHAALAAVSGRTRVRDYLNRHPIDGAVYAVAVGKAAVSMMEGALDVLGQRIAAGLLITKYGHTNPRICAGGTVTCREGAHPYPDQACLEAGAALLKFLDHAPADASLVFLISGGASALVEVLPAGVSLSDLERVNQWLLESGLDIKDVNRVRRRLSCIKGGRLAQHLGSRRALNLLISDVAGDDPAVIGSGLLAAARGEPDPLRGLELPPWIAKLAEAAPPCPSPDDAIFRKVHARIIACLQDALRAAADKGAELGYAVRLDLTPRSGDVGELAQAVIHEMQAGGAGLYICGGEPTVHLPSHPGRGGRMQALALTIAELVSGCDDVLVLAASTDGSDGPGDDAGALVDGTTIERGELAGLDARACLETADAGRFLEASGDLIQTGPTGSNVTDVIFCLKLS